MIARLIADDVDDRRPGAAGVVEIRQAVRQAGAAMEQSDGGSAGHSAIAVRGARRHALEQTKHAVHAGYAVERRNEMHLARPWI